MVQVRAELSTGSGSKPGAGARSILLVEEVVRWTAVLGPRGLGADDARWGCVITDTAARCGASELDYVRPRRSHSDSHQPNSAVYHQLRDLRDYSVRSVDESIVIHLFKPNHWTKSLCRNVGHRNGIPINVAW